ncbi:MAG: UDP-N-acetylglucosamine 2-epimerase (non-hydrolyzing) [Flavobacteriales bacterium]|nr:UDP-N-acetylglucosamine 2-epimerase (non-hydrolyzing) [Flavobacteriales bacterium]
MKKILILVGTRPNFIKVTQFKAESEKWPEIDVKIVHTGQHFDHNMAGVFFEQFSLRPDYFLEIGPGSPNSQIAHIMLKLEELCLNEYPPNLLIVPGDVNSTLAGSLVANKMGIKLAHLESGLRSFDRQMPEEINRLLTDEISDINFITEISGEINLINEKKKGKNFFVGNTMIDTLVAYKKEINRSTILTHLSLDSQEYVLVTIHRPSNVDDLDGLLKLKELFDFLTDQYKVVFPIHPRTVMRMKEFGIYDQFTSNKNLILVDPLAYFEFQKLIKHSKLILTDSGGIQEESTFLRIPCLTLRENTERPSTIEEGTNTLVPFDVELIKSYIHSIEKGTYKTGVIPKYWDGKATQRIMKIISKL